MNKFCVSFNELIATGARTNIPECFYFSCVYITFEILYWSSLGLFDPLLIHRSFIDGDILRHPL